MSPALRFRRSAKRDAAEGPTRPKRGASRSVSRRQPVTPKSSHQISTSHSPNELIAPDLSRQSSSSNLSSEVAPEIVVWTEDMDLDSPSQDDSDVLSDLDMSSDEAPDFYGLSRQADEESDEDDEAFEEGGEVPEDDDEPIGLGDAFLGEVDVASESVNATLRKTHEASEDEAALGDVDEDSEDDDEVLRDVNEAPEEDDGDIKDTDGMLEDANEVSEVNSALEDADGAPEDADQALQDVEEALEVTNEAKDVLAVPAGGEAVRSVSSPSALTELSELSSLSSNVSSKATTPFDADASRGTSADQSAPRAVPVHQTSFYQNEVERLTFNVRPKASIPRNISSQRYAAECIWAAESSRLNPFALHPEEYLLFRHHISHAQVTTYLNIRNGILRQWMTRPSVNVTRQAAIGCANARWFDAASVCYDWLVRRGYINFGCVQFADSKKAPNGDQQDAQRKRRTIVVLGAGISGLGCARQLEGLGTQYASQFHDQGEDPPRVIVLEGRSRVGGRVYSRELKTQSSEKNPQFEGKRLSAEMGGMIITGFDRGNPINILVRAQLGIPYHALTADTTIYDNNGKPVDMVRDLLVEKLYNDCLDRVSEFKHKSQPSKLIEGKRDLIEDGRDAPGDGSKTIMQAEEATAALPHAPPVSLQSVPEHVNMVPVSSDKVTGRVHTQPGVPATLKASEKAKLMGWDAKAGSTDSDNVDLNDAVNQEGLHSAQFWTMQYRNFRLFNWHVANLEYSNATNLHRLSLPLWDIDAGNEWEGHHTMIVGGYQSVARGLVHCPEPLDVRTNFPVKSIKYRAEALNNGPAIIECEDGTVVEADTVVCTIPLGVLKQNSITFDPPLPTWKTGVVGRLGFGILNKVVLIYDKIFWEPDRHIFGVLRDPPNRHSTNQKDYGVNRGRFFQWFNVSNTTGVPCLIALMAGDAGFETEHSSNDILVAEATEILRGVFGSDVPYPVEAMVTRWGSDRFARGSYSSASPEMQPDDYDVMARPIGNLFFAGEHTIGTHPATVHGAYMSGLRAASEVLEAMLGPIEVPTPLVLPKDSLLLQKRQESAKDPRKALLEAYELEVWHHLQSHIGHRPVRPSKPPGNAYMLFSRDKFEEARKLCEENRKPGRTKSAPNEVRVMTSKMWKNASPDERKPYEDQATENKKAYAEALLRHTEESEKWDRQAIALRAAYEKENPKPVDDEKLTPDEGPGPKHRRVRPVSYAEDRGEDRN
uniref:HMG box domain-containing protein n=1 Tax=Bionectria ochroleuca TaxID=29856 RepID=A0A8H7NA60_BIOOC